MANPHQYSAQLASGHSSSAHEGEWGKETPCGTMRFAEKTLAQFLLNRKPRIVVFS